MFARTRTHTPHIQRGTDTRAPHTHTHTHAHAHVVLCQGEFFDATFLLCGLFHGIHKEPCFLAQSFTLDALYEAHSGDIVTHDAVQRGHGDGVVPVEEDRRLAMFGYTAETLSLLIFPMVKTKWVLCAVDTSREIDAMFLLLRNSTQTFGFENEVVW